MAALPNPAWSVLCHEAQHQTASGFYFLNSCTAVWERSPPGSKARRALHCTEQQRRSWRALHFVPEAQKHSSVGHITSPVAISSCKLLVQFNFSASDHISDSILRVTRQREIAEWNLLSNFTVWGNSMPTIAKKKKKKQSAHWEIGSSSKQRWHHFTAWRFQQEKGGARSSPGPAVMGSICATKRGQTAVCHGLPDRRGTQLPEQGCRSLVRWDVIQLR